MASQPPAPRNAAPPGPPGSGEEDGFFKELSRLVSSVPRLRDPVACVSFLTLAWPCRRSQHRS